MKKWVRAIVSETNASVFMCNFRPVISYESDMVMEILVDCSTCISVPTTRARLTIPKMSDGRALCLVLFIGVFTLTNTASVTGEYATVPMSFVV